MPFILLNLATFLVSFGLGYIKFFGLGYVTTQIYTPVDKVWLIQAVGALITIGPAAVYFLAGPLAAARKKRLIMSTFALITGLMFATGALSSFIGTIWIYIFLTGTLMGFFNSAKMACVPLESWRSGKSTVFVNGILTITFTFGMLAGVPSGAAFYEYNQVIGTWFGASIFFAAAVVSWFLHFPVEHLQTFRQSFSNLVSDTKTLGKKYWTYLVSSPMLWGVAGAISLAITAYAEQMKLGDAVLCAYMGLWAAIGIIIGNVVSNYLAGIRYTAAFVSSLILILCILFYPDFIEALGPGPTIEENFPIYIAAASAFIVLGTFFGIVTNLVDADYLLKVGEDEKEGSGAALQSALVAFFNCILNGLVFFTIYSAWLDSKSQFLLIAGMAAVATIPILVLLKGHGGMKQLLGVVLSLLFRFIISLRYKIKVTGMEKIGKQKSLIFLPNHPAEIDPVILCTQLWMPFRIRPIAVETFYHMPGINFVMRLMNTIPIPDLELGFSSYKLRRTENILKQSAECLRTGDNLLVYPAGGLMRSGREVLKGASGVHQLLNEAPDAIPVLVRTRGLWGSMFSTALTEGKTPEIGDVIKKGISIFLKNLIFFTPRRQVEIVVEPIFEGVPRGEEKGVLNQWLEDWYNAPGDEDLSLVSYSFWGQVLPEVKVRQQEEELDLSQVPDEGVKAVLEEFSRMTGRSGDSLDANMSLGNDLGLDSVDLSEVLVWLAERFHATDVSITELNSVGAVMKIAAGTTSKLDEEESPAPKGWTETGSRPGVIPPVGKTLGEAFLRSCERMGKSVAVADEMSGVLTYKRMKLGAIVMSKVIAQMPGEKIGIMLPATAGVGVITFAALLARKVPVMINWTLGPRNLEHVQNLTGIERVITSMKFLDKVGEVDLGSIEDKFVFVEEIRRDEIGLADKLKGALQSMKSADSLIETFGLDQVSKDDPAVILFTSGSETVPKGVPLSHENILSNICGAMEVFDFGSKDCVYGFLPPFHSFGMTVTTVLPITSGMKAAYYANPNESRKLARGTKKWGATIVCGTPSFLAGIFKASEDDQLNSVRYLIAGAEKAPDDLFRMVDDLGNGAQLVEGYGITECSPILSMNRPGQDRDGVGLPSPGVEIRVVKDGTYESIPTGERGMIIATGANIFRGYLGENPPNPFHEMEDQRWYVTGDLGYMTENGAVVISGRKKRFVKVAGEMISLPAMEETLYQKWPISDDGPTVAVEALEKEGQRPVMCMFSTTEASIEEANGLLKEAGFSNVGRLTNIRSIPVIPLLGSGKTDYRTLKKILEEA